MRRISSLQFLLIFIAFVAAGCGDDDTRPSGSDSGPRDAAAIPVDSARPDGAVVRPDAGLTDVDGGPSDAGVVVTPDSGPSMPDAGSDTDAGPGTDAGPADVDAGSGMDAGAGMDAGGPTTDAGAGTCPNSIVEVGETCDDGNLTPSDGCSSTCATERGWTCMGAPSACVTTCGDGIIVGTEGCDDGDAASLDGCSATCTIEPGFSCVGEPSICGLPEVEPNDTCDPAAGPVTPPGAVVGAISPVGDVDYIPIVVSGIADLRIETFSEAGLCTGIDTTIELFEDDCTTSVAFDDDGSTLPGLCSLLDPAMDAEVQRLAPGTYYLAVRDFGGDEEISAYLLTVTFTALCGNGVVEAPEECDGSPTCDASCNIIPTCGDGLVSPPIETCDDMGVMAGDGCSLLCQTEPGYRCTGAPSVCTRIEYLCNDGMDDDTDGLSDCTDTDCAAACALAPCAAGDRLVQLHASDTPRAILDFEIVDSSVSGIAGTINRLAVSLAATHTYDGDLLITLTSPGGTTIDLSNRNGGSGENYTGTIFDSTCGTDIADGTPPFTGCFAPDESLAPFTTTSFAGVWTLHIEDLAGADEGSLADWSLLACLGP